MTLTATLRHPASLRPCPGIHVRSFGRSDEILYLVEKASDLTLPDSVRCHRVAAQLSQIEGWPIMRALVAHVETELRQFRCVFD